MDGKISNLQQIASVRRYTVDSGREQGIKVIDCDNGSLRFLLNESKALDIMQLYHKGQNVSFLSKNAFVKSELPFLRRFEGGMLYTCGLDCAGKREGHEQHGTFHNLPADVITAYADSEGIAVQAVIRDTQLFGKNLVMKRRISAKQGADTLTLTDTLTNEGYNDENYCLLYHINIGYPMLDDGCVIIADIEEYEARGDYAKETASDMLKITDAVPNQRETCYFLDLRTPKIALENKKLGKRFELTYSGDTLTDFIEWTSMASGDYALGFEPSTTKLTEKFVYKTLAPGASVEFSFNIKISEI